MGDSPTTRQRKRPEKFGIAAVGTHAIKTQALIRFLVEERSKDPLVKYVDLRRKAQARFHVGEHVATRALVEADRLLREEFDAWVPNAPRMLLDAYLDLHVEALKEKNLAVARGCLDSIRDMFGMKSAVNVVVSTGAPSTAYAPLSNEELEIISKLDLPTEMPIIDASSVEATVGLASIAVDAMGAQEIDDEEFVESDESDE